MNKNGKLKDSSTLTRYSLASIHSEKGVKTKKQRKQDRSDSN